MAKRIQYHPQMYMLQIALVVLEHTVPEWQQVDFIQDDVRRILKTTRRVEVTLEGPQFLIILGLRNDGTNNDPLTAIFEKMERDIERDLCGTLPSTAPMKVWDEWQNPEFMTSDDQFNLQQMMILPRIMEEGLFKGRDNEGLSESDVRLNQLSQVNLLIGYRFEGLYGWNPLPYIKCQQGELFRSEGGEPPTATCPPPCISKAENESIKSFFQRSLTTYRMEGDLGQLDIEDDDEQLAEIVSLIEKMKEEE